MKKCIVCYLVIAITVIGMVPPVEASFMPSETLTTTGSDRAEDLQTVQTVLESKFLRQRLADLGFTTEEVRSRIAQLSDQQIHQLAQSIDEMRIGGDGGAVIGVLLIIGLIVLIYLLLTHRVAIQ